MQGHMPHGDPKDRMILSIPSTLRNADTTAYLNHENIEMCKILQPLSPHLKGQHCNPSKGFIVSLFLSAVPSSIEVIALDTRRYGTKFSTVEAT